MRFWNAQLSRSPLRSVTWSWGVSVSSVVEYGGRLTKIHSVLYVLRVYEALFYSVSKKSVFSGAGHTHVVYSQSFFISFTYSHLFIPPFTQLTSIYWLPTLPATVPCPVGHSNDFLTFNIFHCGWIYIVNSIRQGIYILDIN